MIFWVREVAGWALIALGLMIFVKVYDYCERHWIFEAGILMLVGIIVFRGGIHLLLVGVAANAARKAQTLVVPPAPVRTAVVSTRRGAG